jgi:hypothetical protein
MRRFNATDELSAALPQAVEADDSRDGYRLSENVLRQSRFEYLIRYRF